MARERRIYSNSVAVVRYNPDYKEYVVVPVDGSESYFTDDKQDAIETCNQMEEGW